MKDWYDLYLEEIKLKKDLTHYVDYKIKNKKKLIKLIKKYSKNKKVLEAGSGTGIISTYMSSIGYNVTELDINDKILSLAKNISRHYIKKGKPKFIKKNLFEMDFKKNEFDVIFSNGVLEHFSDNEIKKILSLELEQAKYVIVGVPTRFFKPKDAMHGDERYLKIKYWRKLFHEVDAEIIEETSYHYMTFKEKLLNLNKLFKIKPFWVFVLKKK